MIVAFWACSTPPPEEVAVTSKIETKVIGHRGSPGHLPDHTLEGYRLAVAQGADFIEPDLVPTRDGVLIARHENDLTHTTDIASHYPDRSTTKTVDGKTLTGWFSEDFTYRELQVVRAVQPYPSRPQGHNGRYAIPTFAEVLALREELERQVGRPVGIMPEMKHPHYFRTLGMPVEAKVANELEKASMNTAKESVVVQSFEPDSLVRLQKATGVRTLLLFDTLTRTPVGHTRTYQEMFDDLGSIPVDAIGVHTTHIWSDDRPNDLVTRAHAANKEVYVYTFRMEADKLSPAAEGDPRLELRRFFELGVDGVFADYPDVAVAVRQQLQ